MIEQGASVYEKNNVYFGYDYSSGDDYSVECAFVVQYGKYKMVAYRYMQPDKNYWIDGITRLQ